LPKEIPQRDVYPADRVRDRSSPTKPEHVLVQLLAYALGLKRTFTTIQWLKDIEGGANERVIREDAANSNRAFIGMDGDKRVHAVVWAELIAPAAFWGRAAQAGTANFSDLHRQFRVDVWGAERASLRG
jgi:hypothetical protein